jgi:3-hydroxyisobutyryl-CoA hydrolase
MIILTNSCLPCLITWNLYQPTVLFETNLALRNYILNRPKKLNALDESMITLLRSQVEVRHSPRDPRLRLINQFRIQEWGQSPLTGAVVGTGVGRAFCAGGDVACESHWLFFLWCCS